MDSSDSRRDFSTYHRLVVLIGSRLMSSSVFGILSPGWELFDAKNDHLLRAVRRVWCTGSVKLGAVQLVCFSLHRLLKTP
jgi:hypothetical protein